MAVQAKTVREGTGNPGNKEKILECAQDLFCARGYDAVGVQEIVDKASLTKPTLYYYFGSKKGLLEELLARKFEALRERIGPIVKRQSPIRETLHALAGEYAAYFQKEQQFYLLMMALNYSARENESYITILPHMQWLYESVKNVFEQASAELGNMRGRQGLFAIGFIGTVNQYISMLLEQSMGPDHDGAQLHAAVDQFMYGIFS